MPVANIIFPFVPKNNPSAESDFTAEFFSNVTNYSITISNKSEGFIIPPTSTLKIVIDDLTSSSGNMASINIPVKKCLNSNQANNQIMFDIIPAISETNNLLLGDTLIGVGFTSMEVKAINTFHANVSTTGNSIECFLIHGNTYVVKLVLSVNGVTYVNPQTNRPTFTYNNFAPDFNVNLPTNILSVFNVTQAQGSTDFIVSGLDISNIDNTPGTKLFSDLPQTMTITFDELDPDNSNTEETYEAVLNMDANGDGIVNYLSSTMTPYDLTTQYAFSPNNNSGVYIIQTPLIQGGFKKNCGYITSCNATFGNNVTINPYTKRGAVAWNMKPAILNKVSCYDATPLVGTLPSTSTQQLITVTLKSTDPENSSMAFWGYYKPNTVDFVLTATIDTVQQTFTSTKPYLSVDAITNMDKPYSIKLKDMVPAGSYVLSNGIVYTLNVVIHWVTAPLLGGVPNPIWPVGISRTSAIWAGSEVIFDQNLAILTELQKYNAWEALAKDNSELITDSMPERGVILSFTKNDLFNINDPDNLDVDSTKFHVQYSLSAFGVEPLESDWTDVTRGGIAQASGAESETAASIRQGAAAAFAAYSPSTTLSGGLFPLPSPPVPAVLGSEQPPLYVYVPNVGGIFNESLTLVVNFRVSIKTSQAKYLPNESNFTPPGSLYIVNKPDVYSWAVPSNAVLEPFMDFDSNYLVLPMDNSDSNSFYYKQAHVSWTSNDATNPAPALIGEGQFPSFNVLLGQTVSYKVIYEYYDPNSLVAYATLLGKQSGIYSAVCKGLPELDDYAVTNNNNGYIYDNANNELVFDLHMASASVDRRIDGVDLFLKMTGLADLPLNTYYASTYVSGKQTVALSPLLSAAQLSLTYGSEYTLVFKPFRDRHVSSALDDISSSENEKYGLEPSWFPYVFEYISPATENTVVGYSWTVNSTYDHEPYMLFGSQLQLIIPMNTTQTPNYKDATIEWVNNGPIGVGVDNTSHNVTGNLPAFNVVAGTVITYNVTYNYYALDGSVISGAPSNNFEAVCKNSPINTDYTVSDFAYKTFNNNSNVGGSSNVSFKLAENVSSVNRLDGVDVYFQASGTPAVPKILMERYRISELSDTVTKTLKLVNPAGSDGKTYILRLVVDSNGNPVLDVNSNHTYFQTSYVWQNKRAGVVSFVAFRDRRVVTQSLYTEHNASINTPAPPANSTGTGNVFNIPVLKKPSLIANATYSSPAEATIVLLANGALAGASGSGDIINGNSGNNNPGSPDPTEAEENAWGGADGILLTSGIMGQNKYLVWKPTNEEDVIFNVMMNGVEQDVDASNAAPYASLICNGVTEYTVLLTNHCNIEGTIESSLPNTIVFSSARVVTSGMVVAVNNPSTNNSLSVSWLPPVIEGALVITSTKLTDDGTNVDVSISAVLKETSPKTYNISSLSLGHIMKLEMAVRARINYTVDSTLCSTYATRISRGYTTEYAISTIPSVSLSSATSTVLIQGATSSPSLLLNLDAKGLEAEGFISLVVILTQDGTPIKPGGIEVLLQFPASPSSQPFSFVNTVGTSTGNLVAGTPYSASPLNDSPTGLSNSAVGPYTLTIGSQPSGNTTTPNPNPNGFSLSSLTFPSSSGFITDPANLVNIMAILTSRRGTDIMVGSFEYLMPPVASAISITSSGGNYYVNFTLS